MVRDRLNPRMASRAVAKWVSTRPPVAPKEDWKDRVKVRLRVRVSVRVRVRVRVRAALTLILKLNP